MSNFACTVERVRIEPHPNADRIEIACVGDFKSIVQKGQFKDGDLAVYIPESAVVPRAMLEVMGMWDDVKEKGKLSGAAGNRVKAIKLRGVLSQGLLWPVVSLDKGVLSGAYGQSVKTFSIETTHAVGIADVHPELGPDVYDFVDVTEGQNVAEILGIVKYEPPIPSHMAGRIAGADLEATIHYDLDNIKKMPDLFDEGEPVVMTEKIHGTFMMVGVVPERLAKEKYYKGRIVLSSKGLAKQGYILDASDDTNLYVQAAKKYGLLDKMCEFAWVADEFDQPYFILGEVFGVMPGGKGVQDLTYGAGDLQFRLFEEVLGTRGNEKWGYADSIPALARRLDVPHVPILYRGPFSRAALETHTNGLETVSGANSHIREGVVIRTLLLEGGVEAQHPRHGRKIAKSVSEAYLLRKGEVTEFN
jgi:RNA ligase (TIGR02306 family)